MKKVIKKYKTVSASSEDEFNDKVNTLLDMGWELADGGFRAILERDDKITVETNVNTSISRETTEIRIKKNKNDEDDNYDDEYNISLDSGEYHAHPNVDTYISGGESRSLFAQVLVYMDYPHINPKFFDDGQPFKIRKCNKDGRIINKKVFHESRVRNQKGKQVYFCEEYNYKNGNLNGEYTKKCGSRIFEKGTYKDGKFHGEFNTYFDTRDNMISGAYNYKNGLKHGEQIEYDQSGNKKNVYNYKNGILFGKQFCNLTIRDAYYPHKEKTIKIE